MNHIHNGLTQGRWLTIPFIEQMANIGSEIARTLSWKDRNEDYSARAFERALELLDLTISDKKNIKRLKELLRLREMLADYFYFDNIYASNAGQWHKYFNAFTYAAAHTRQNSRKH